MPRGTTKRVPNRSQRALQYYQRRQALLEAEAKLTPAESARYRELLREADWPFTITDRAAILDRARAHVANEALADREHSKTPEQHRRELFGS